MIEVKVKNCDMETVIGFPCTEKYLAEKLREVGITDELPPPLHVVEVLEGDGLELLAGKYLDLDEANYLGKLLEGMTNAQMDKFAVVARKEGFGSAKDLINLTFNDQRYTLIQNIGDMTAVGRTHMITRNLAIPADKSKDAEYAKIGKELLESGKGIWTEKGLLFVNDDIPFEEVYKGETFPAYAYKEHLLEMELDFLGAKEYLYLPEEDIAIKKALSRLGLEGPANCNAMMIYCNTTNGAYAELLENIVNSEDIYAVNAFAKRAEYLDDVEMFIAVADYADVTSAKEATALINHLDEFNYIDGISDEHELGQHLVEYDSDYECADEVKDFIDYRDFGRYICNEYNGQFVNSGFVYIPSGKSLEQIIDVENDIKMGGM